MKTILFQGDSITDSGRDRGNKIELGKGYPLLVAGELGFEKPNDYVFFNRGVGGDRIIDLIARIKKDTINLKPDVMSILIGVNDIWHNLSDDPNGIDADEFEEYYDLLIVKLLKALPKLKIMILEPFVLKGAATEDSWEIFRPELEKRAAVSKRIAEKYNLVFVPLLEKFDKAAEIAPSSHWTWDGVHPKPAGHELIKKEWLKAFKKSFDD